MRNLGSPINSSVNEGTMVVTADGGTAYFVSCGRPGGKGDCDIYRARLQAGVWGDVENVAALNSPAWESQPTISDDGKTIYFVSNRSSNGSVDIYVAHMSEEGFWSTPVILDDSINTSAQEGAPFIAPGNVLYFASDRERGFGGYDFYASRMKGDGSWSTPRNLGAPINTASDERFMVLTPSNDAIYYASNVPKGSARDLDLFTAKLTHAPATILVAGKVYGRFTNAPVGASLAFIDPATGDTVAITRSDQQTGLYAMTLTGGPAMAMLVAADAPSYYHTTNTIGIPASDEYQELQYDIVLDEFIGTGVEEEREDRREMPTVHPNPATGWVTIECPALRKGMVTVSDLYGERRCGGALVDGRCTLDVTGLPSGIYLARVGGRAVPLVVRR